MDRIAHGNKTYKLFIFLAMLLLKLYLSLMRTKSSTPMIRCWCLNILHTTHKAYTEFYRLMKYVFWKIFVELWSSIINYRVDPLQHSLCMWLLVISIHIVSDEELNTYIFKRALFRYNLYTIKCPQFKCTIQRLFHKFKELCNHCSVLGHSYYPREIIHSH